MIHRDLRTAEIEANLASVEHRVAAACAAVGRSPSELTVVAVTKTFPAEDIARLHALGLREIGENRDQDAVAKVGACAAMGLTDLRWHFVGQLQRNKAASVATYANVIHSVDRQRLVTSLDSAAAKAGRTPTCLVQVDLREPPQDDGRGGAAPADVERLAASVAAAEHLTVGGVMAVAPLDSDPAVAFRALARIATRLRSTYPQAVVVSAGMSADLEAAIEAGATHLRLGSALLGSRPPLR
jgi:hypothetical protein